MWKKNYGTSNEDTKKTEPPIKDSKRRRDEEAMRTIAKRKKKLLLPWWCVIFSWILVIASVGCSLFFLWAYGLQFGNERTAKWLTSLIISFFSSVLLTEPIKVIFNPNFCYFEKCFFAAYLLLFRKLSFLTTIYLTLLIQNQI